MEMNNSTLPMQCRPLLAAVEFLLVVDARFTCQRQAALCSSSALLMQVQGIDSSELIERKCRSLCCRSAKVNLTVFFFAVCSSHPLLWFASCSVEPSS